MKIYFKKKITSEKKNFLLKQGYSERVTEDGTEVIYDDTKYSLLLRDGKVHINDSRFPLSVVKMVYDRYCEHKNKQVNLSNRVILKEGTKLKIDSNIPLIIDIEDGISKEYNMIGICFGKDYIMQIDLDSVSEAYQKYILQEIMKHDLVGWSIRYDLIFLMRWCQKLGLECAFKKIIDLKKIFRRVHNFETIHLKEVGYWMGYPWWGDITDVKNIGELNDYNVYDLSVTNELYWELLQYICMSDYLEGRLIEYSASVKLNGIRMGKVFKDQLIREYKEVKEEIKAKEIDNPETDHQTKDREKKLDNLYSRYLNLSDKDTLHPDVLVGQTKTGRLLIVKPNLHTIPKEFRLQFFKNDLEVVEFDVVACELLFYGIVHKIPKLLEIYRDFSDPYEYFRDRIKVSKQDVLSLLYGKSLSEDTVSIWCEALELGDLRKLLLRDQYDSFYVTPYFGRSLQTPDRNKYLNYPVQSLSSDFVQAVAMRVWKQCRGVEGSQMWNYLISVHDSLIFESWDRDELEATLKVVSEDVFKRITGSNNITIPRWRQKHL